MRLFSKKFWNDSAQFSANQNQSKKSFQYRSMEIGWKSIWLNLNESKPSFQSDSLQSHFDFDSYWKSRIESNWRSRINFQPICIQRYHIFVRNNLDWRGMVCKKISQWRWKALTSTNFGLNFISKYYPPIWINPKKNFNTARYKLVQNLGVLNWLGLKACFRFIRIESIELIHQAVLKIYSG